MSESKRGRGRPVKCDPKVRRAVAGLVKVHGLTKTMKILAARQGKLVELRDKEIFPKALPLTLPTIRKYASEYGVGELPRGRAAEGAKKAKKATKKAEPKKAKKAKKAKTEPKVEAAPVVAEPAPVAAETVVEPVAEVAAPVAAEPAVAEPAAPAAQEAA